MPRFPILWPMKTDLSRFDLPRALGLFFFFGADSVGLGPFVSLAVRDQTLRLALARDLRGSLRGTVASPDALCIGTFGHSRKCIDSGPGAFRTRPFFGGLFLLFWLYRCRYLVKMAFSCNLSPRSR